MHFSDLEDKIKRLEAELAKQKKDSDETVAKLKQQFEKDMNEGMTPDKVSKCTFRRIILLFQCLIKTLKLFMT